MERRGWPKAGWIYTLLLFVYLDSLSKLWILHHKYCFNLLFLLLPAWPRFFTPFLSSRLSLHYLPHTDSPQIPLLSSAKEPRMILHCPPSHCTHPSTQQPLEANLSMSLWLYFSLFPVPFTTNRFSVFSTSSRLFLPSSIFSVNSPNFLCYFLSTLHSSFKRSFSQ